MVESFFFFLPLYFLPLTDVMGSPVVLCCAWDSTKMLWSRSWSGCVERRGDWTFTFFCVELLLSGLVSFEFFSFYLHEHMYSRIFIHTELSHASRNQARDIFERWFCMENLTSHRICQMTFPRVRRILSQRCSSKIRRNGLLPTKSTVWYRWSYPLQDFS